jgi:hypothetical protein
VVSAAVFPMGRGADECLADLLSPPVRCQRATEAVEASVRSTPLSPIDPLRKHAWEAMCALGAFLAAAKVERVEAMSWAFERC